MTFYLVHKSRKIKKYNQKWDKNLYIGFVSSKILKNRMLSF